MITPVRITVDEATREILDQLEAQLTQTPAWADRLQDAAQAEWRALSQQSHQAQKSLAQQFEPLATATRAVQGQLSGLSVDLDTVHTSVKALQLDLTTQGMALAGIRQALPEAMEHLTRSGEAIDGVAKGLAANFRSFQEQLVRLQRRVDEVLAVQARLAEDHLKAEALQREQRAALATLEQQLRQSTEQQATAHQQLADAMRAAHQAQRDQLQVLGHTLRALSRPWWQRLFNKQEA